MTDTATSRLGARQQSQGSNTNTWGDDKLNEVMRLIDRAMHGVESLAMTGDTTLSWANYVATNTGQIAFLTLTGSLSSAAALIVPSVQWAWKGIANATGQTITVRTSAGTGVTIPNGRQISIRCDGSDCYYAGGNYIGADITETNSHDLVDYSALGAYVTAAINAASTNINGAFSTTYLYTATGGETSKSGTDDNGLTLAYTVNYEKVYLNGVLLVRAVDYVATTGTSITGLTALQASDVLTIVAEAAYAVANTYTQAQVDALISNDFAIPPALGFGSTTARPVAATTLSATGTVSGAGFTARFASPGPIGNTSASTGAFTTVSASGQITSTVSTGTAPFVVASTTNVANLNASSLSGATFAVPGPIGSTTRSTGAFTTLVTASTLTIGSSSTDQIVLQGGSGQALVSTSGGSTDVSAIFGTKGAGRYSFTTAAFADEQFRINALAGATQFPIATGTNAAGGVIDTSGGKLDLKSAGTSVLQLATVSALSQVTLTAIPTSSAGLSANSLYKGAANAAFFA